MAKKQAKKATLKATPKPKERPDHVEVPASKCRKCGSHKRADYYGVVTRKLSGKIVKWRRTRCAECGQSRIDKTIT